MFRMLLVNGAVVEQPTELRRRLLRFTGSRRATRAIMQRIDAARNVGHIAGLLVKTIPAAAGTTQILENTWEVGVTYATRYASAGTPTWLIESKAGIG